MVKVKKIFLLQELSEKLYQNDYSFHSPSGYPCSSKVVPVSNTKEKVGQILNLSSFYYIPCYFMPLSTAEHI